MICYPGPKDDILIGIRDDNGIKKYRVYSSLYYNEREIYDDRSHLLVPKSCCPKASWITITNDDVRYE